MMRLWHYKILPYLPKSQLVAQWRELNSIFKKQDKHILINYIYNYSKAALLIYSCKVIEELRKRNYKIKSFDNAYNYFGNNAIFLEYAKTPEKAIMFPESWHYTEHNNEYLTICYWNLREKYIRGQKDFTDEVWNKFEKFYKKEMKNGTK